jgi:hypothetical protein
MDHASGAGSFDSPIKYTSTARAALRPSAIAHTMNGLASLDVARGEDARHVAACRRDQSDVAGPKTQNTPEQHGAGGVAANTDQ